MTERTAWPDSRIDREFDRVYKQINGLPRDVIRLEQAVKTLGLQVQDLVHENEQLRAEIRGDKWSRTQILTAFATVAAFIGSVAAVASVVIPG